MNLHEDIINVILNKPLTEDAEVVIPAGTKKASETEDAKEDKEEKNAKKNAKKVADEVDDDAEDGDTKQSEKTKRITSMDEEIDADLKDDDEDDDDEIKSNGRTTKGNEDEGILLNNKTKKLRKEENMTDKDEEDDVEGGRKANKTRWERDDDDADNKNGKKREDVSEARKQKVEEEDEIDWDVDGDDEAEDATNHEKNVRKEEVADLQWKRGSANDASKDNEQLKGKYKGNERSQADVDAFEKKGAPAGKADPGAEEENERIKRNYKNNERKDMPKLPEIKKMNEHLDTLFDGESLSEEFKNKVAAVFEAAVNERVDSMRETIKQAVYKKYSRKLREQREQTAEQIDGYLSYVAESWVKQNEIALESGIKVSLMENFMRGMKNLFEQHYVELPDEKVDVLKDITRRLEIADRKLNEQVDQNIKLKKKIREQSRQTIVTESLSGLTDLDKDRVQSLIEHVEFNGDTAEYRTKVETIRENYLKGKTRRHMNAGEPHGAEVNNGQSKVLTEVDQIAESITKIYR